MTSSKMEGGKRWGRGARRRKGHEKEQLSEAGGRGGLGKRNHYFLNILRLLSKQKTNPSSKEAPTHSCFHPPTLERVMKEYIFNCIETFLKIKIKGPI